MPPATSTSPTGSAPGPRAPAGPAGPAVRAGARAWVATLMRPSTLAGLGALVLLALVAQRAWVADDAFITLRTVDHFVHGRGLVWNTGFRVQAYTHPAWMLLLSCAYACTREPYLTTLAVSLVTTGAAAYLLLRDLTASPPAKLAALAVLGGSQAFVDYGTSGLENPLSHLLLVLALRAWLAPTPRLTATAVPLGLLVVTRHDLALLSLPLTLGVLAALRSAPRAERAKALAALVVPGLLWTAFALVYYGAPVPNTAYAKLGGELPRAEVVASGVGYLVSTAQADPATLVGLALGVVAGLASNDRGRRPLALGVLLYLAYVVWVGGDFMRGRFLTAPLVVAVALMAAALDAHAPRPRRALAALVCAGSVALGLARPAGGAATIDARGVADERAHWASATGIEHGLHARALHAHPHVVEARARAAQARAGGPRVVGSYTAGFSGYFAGPDVHVVEWFGLTDPVLARQPAVREVHTRPGHRLRYVDDDYVAMLDDVVRGRPFHCRGEPVRCALLRDVLVITRGPLLSADRFAAIRRQLAGRHPWGAAREQYRRPHMPVLTAAQVASVVPAGTPWSDRRVRHFRDDGLTVVWPTTLGADRSLEVTLDHNDVYRLVLQREGADVASHTVGPRAEPGLARYLVPLHAAGHAGVDRVLVEPVEGDGLYGLGHLRLVPAP